MSGSYFTAKSKEKNNNYILKNNYKSVFKYLYNTINIVNIVFKFIIYM